MLYLALCIALTTVLFIQFREFARYKLSLLQIVAINYAVCVACGLAVHPGLVQFILSHLGTWLWFAAGQGALFMAMFWLTGLSAQRAGLGYTTMVTKMSVVTPILISLFVYRETLGAWQWLGVACALAAIVLVHLKYLGPGANQEHSGQVLLLGLVLFVGTGFTDANFKIYREEFGTQASDEAFTIAVFFFAAVFGFAALAVQAIRGIEKLSWQNALGGVVLGVPNYFTVLFLLYGLQVIPGATFYPLNNIGLLVLASLAGVLRYREQLSWSGWGGLGLAVLAIILLMIR